MTSNQNLPAVGSVWGKPDDVASWCRFLGVDDDRGYHWETWRGEFFETELSREPSAVDIKAMVASARDKLVDAEIQRDKAIELLKRYYTAGHRQGWEEGESNAECFAAVNDFLSNMLGGDWDMLGMAEVATAFGHALDQPFTVDWLVEIGGHQFANGIVFFISPHDVEFDYWQYKHHWTLDGEALKTSITTRRDVLKWLDVLGIEPTTKG